MAKRKGVSKARNVGTRKQVTETSNAPKEGIRLKNDPGGTHDMDQSKLISSKKVQSNSEEYRLNSNNYVDSLSHRKNSSHAKSGEDSVNTNKSDSTNSADLINSNNNNSKTCNSSSNDLKYLHKKFKRIASATLDEVKINHHQPTEIIGNPRIISNSQEDSSKSVNNINNVLFKESSKAQHPYPSLNGHADVLTRISVPLDGAKRVFITPELNGDVKDVHKGSSSFRTNYQNVNVSKFSPNHEDSSHSNSSIKLERASPVVNTNLNNNILSRVPLITSTFNSNSSPVSTTTAPNVSNHQKILQQLPSQRPQQREVADQSFSGRHVCPYCNLNCTKPSVLQKHIRAHTNERPYPCDTCGFAFKTKSNYYKHCRSRSHALRTKGGEAQPDDDGSLGSDQDQDPDLSNSSSDVISRTASPMDERTSSPAVQQQAAQAIQKYLNEKPYKPKFHNAALYAKEEISQQQKQQLNNNHQSQIVTNYYQPSSYHQQPHEQDPSIQFQHQTSKSRSEQAPPPPPPPHTHAFQQVTSSYIESTQQQSIRESTSTSFSGISATGGGHQLNREFLQEHISKIISQNEAIVENKELLLQKKYPKISGKSKSSTLVLSNESSNSKLAFALANKQQHLLHRDEVPSCKANAIANPLTNSGLPNSSGLLSIPRGNQQVQAGQIPEVLSTSQPLNLSKIVEQIDNTRKRASADSLSTTSSENNSLAPVKIAPSRPPTQERSIIKHLLLNARGLGVPNGEGEDAVYTCPLCKMEFRSAEDLRLHTSNYCQGGPSSAPISPVASPSYKYFRSNSINVNLPEFNNPNSLAKLARSSLLHLSRNPLSLAKLAWSQLKTKPSNLVLNQLNVNTNTTAASSSSQSDSIAIPSKAIDTPLPSPGPLLGKTPLVEAYNNSERKSEEVVITKVHEENRNFAKEFSPKRLRLNNYPQQHFSTIVNECSSSAASGGIPNYNSVSIAFELAQNKSHQHQPSFPMCGGEVQMLDKKEDRMRRFLSSGGCIIPISECPDIEVSPKMIRTPLLSGGSFTEVSPKPSSKETQVTPSTTPKMMIPIAPLTPSLPAPNLLSAGLPLAQHFQFPPINSITAFNPLTLPPVSIVPSSVMHGDKLIPFVPGIPGPNTLALPTIPHQSQLNSEISLSRNISPSRKKTPSPLIQNSMTLQGENSAQHIVHSPNLRHKVLKPIIRIECESPLATLPTGGESIRLPSRSPRHWSHTSTSTDTVKKSFNFTRMADNLSPRKNSIEKTIKSPEREREVRHFNFENIPKLDVAATPPHPPLQQQEQPLMPLHVDVSSSNSSTTLPKEPSETEISEAKSKAKSKFLRPTSLPLKPGTFTPKRHHGITPTANTLPLISPETPRPSKACVQLYLNGHAYTYLGLKCSTKMFYCTVNCPQPSYVANLHKLSMYSVWQVCAESNPHQLGLKPKIVMSLYDSRQHTSTYTTAEIKLPYTTVHSQSTVMTPFESNSSTTGQFYHHHQIKSIQPPTDSSLKNEGSSKSNSSVLVGGYESNEDYTYIRGRGRGRYVCSECGIRCKKPSMLKKHIRTHTDVRPYTCQHCSFSFKTKGNLTKHMQSKTHYKKCLELGINPGPMPSEGDYMDTDGDTDQQSTISGGGRTSSIQGESDSDDYSDIGDGETESSDTDESKSRLPEHEAARCLLSLSMTPPVNSAPVFHGRSHYSSYKQQSLPDSSQTGGLGVGCSTEESQNSLQSYSPRRVISFTSPKPPFDYQKQEQYYSNPSIPKTRDDKFDELNMKPIDLTKPRHLERPRISEVIGDLANESGLLRSLVSNTDKVRNSTEPVVHTQRVDESVLLQAYLTEQALKYTKIKQSQMNKNFPEISSCSTTSTTISTVVSLSCGFDRVTESSVSSNCYSGRLSELPSVTVTHALTVTTLTAASRPISSVSEQGKLPTDSEITKGTTESEISTTPAHRIESNRSPLTNLNDSKSENDNKSLTLLNSAVLQNTPAQDVNKDLSQSPRPRSLPSGTGGAKSVASEYLKMTSAEYLKSRGNRTEESEESSSDQEINVTENSGSSSSLKPPSDFSGVLARTVIVGEDGFKSSSNEVQPMFPRIRLSDDGRPVCTICSKSFQKQHQMVLHMNIHYMERKFKCEPCAVSFRTQGHLQKHERSEAHKNKVMMTSTFGVPTTSNPRPFECSDCKVAFRIHGHLAKHLRSKTHVQKLECLQKLPFGTYAEIERAGISLTEIDTTDCDNSLASLKALAQKLIEKDPSKLNSYSAPPCMETNSGGAASQDSGGEDSPDRPGDLNEVNRELTELSPLQAPMPSSEGSGVKRKHDSFSSCSNDSIVNVTQQEIGLEKRPRTTSET